MRAIFKEPILNFLVERRIHYEKTAVMLAMMMLLTMILPGMFPNANAVSDQSYSTVSVYTHDSFVDAFNTGMISLNGQRSSVQTMSENVGVTYSYEFEPCDETSSIADVVLMLSLYIGSETYSCQLTGGVEANSLSSGDILWTGPIRGNMIIGGCEYNIIAAFSKNDGDPAIQVDATIQPIDESSSQDLIIFSFGGEVITVDVFPRTFYCEAYDAHRTVTITLG